MIFATSTPVNEAAFPLPNESMRYNEDIELYNNAAVNIVKEFGHEVNDLYALMKDQPLSDHSDVVHYYSRSGAELPAAKVCDCIGKAIDEPVGKINFDKWFDDADSYIGEDWGKKRNSLLNGNTVIGT